MNTLLNIAIIVISVALIASVMLQNKGIGPGGLTGGDSGGVYTQRRGIDKVLYYVTLCLSIVFVILALISVYISGSVVA